AGRRARGLAAGPIERAPQLLQAPRQLGLDSAVRRLVEALALHAVRDHLLAGDTTRLVVWIHVADAAPELARAVVVGVAQVRRRRLGAVLAHVGGRSLDPAVGGVRFRRQR